jgi:hypothetical protein
MLPRPKPNHKYSSYKRDLNIDLSKLNDDLNFEIPQDQDLQELSLLQVEFRAPQYESRNLSKKLDFDQTSLGQAIRL